MTRAERERERERERECEWTRASEQTKRFLFIPSSPSRRDRRRAADETLRRVGRPHAPRARPPGARRNGDEKISYIHLFSSSHLGRLAGGFVVVIAYVFSLSCH